MKAKDVKTEGFYWYFSELSKKYVPVEVISWTCPDVFYIMFIGSEIDSYIGDFAGDFIGSIKQPK